MRERIRIKVSDIFALSKILTEVNGKREETEKCILNWHQTYMI